MRIVITDWALDAYDEMRGRDFSEEEYWQVLRPDIERLFQRASDLRFREPRFWGPAQDDRGDVPDGYKMKWHNIGPGLLQLRLGVALVHGDAWLCHAWSKTSPKQDSRCCAVLRYRISLIREGLAIEEGVIREPGA